MIIVVPIDQDGTILGTMRSASTSQPNQPSVGFAPRPGQTIQEIELPDEVENVEDLSSVGLRLAVKKHLTDNKRSVIPSSALSGGVIRFT